MENKKYRNKSIPKWKFDIYYQWYHRSVEKNKPFSKYYWSMGIYKGEKMILESYLT